MMDHHMKMRISVFIHKHPLGNFEQFSGDT